MTTLHIVGGIYAERAIWPDWDQVYGSAGRAGAAVKEHVGSIVVEGYATGRIASRFEAVAKSFGFAFRRTHAAQEISFSYTHGLALPTISPARPAITQNAMIEVDAENVLRFGMLEGDARVTARRCVYDPQDQIAPAVFGANGSRSDALAIVANQTEVMAMTGAASVEDAVGRLLRSAEVVVVKSGPLGAFVHARCGSIQVPAYKTNFVWPVGSGDVFAAMFAARWAAHGDEPAVAADLASRAVAAYVESMALPAPGAETLASVGRPPATSKPGRVYLASPFFSMGERWVVEEARRALLALGMEVFSPFHDVGPGPAAEVAPADLAAVDDCDVMFAVLDGLDSGTIFEVGYARRAGKPVYGLAQTVAEEDLKMIEGSGCKLHSDFVTALHHVVWRA
jgi:hypothetical protein